MQPETIIMGEPYMDLDALMKKADGLLASLNETVDGNQDKISNIITNFEATSKNLEEFSADVKAHPWKLFFKSKEAK